METEKVWCPCTWGCEISPWNTNSSVQFKTRCRGLQSTTKKKGFFFIWSICPAVSPEATAAFLSLTLAQNGHVSGTFHACGGQKCPRRGLCASCRSYISNPKKWAWSGGKPNWQKAQNNYQQVSSLAMLAQSRGG